MVRFAFLIGGSVALAVAALVAWQAAIGSLRVSWHASPALWWSYLCLGDGVSCKVLELEHDVAMIERQRAAWLDPDTSVTCTYGSVRLSDDARPVAPEADDCREESLADFERMIEVRQAELRALRTSTN